MKKEMGFDRDGSIIGFFAILINCGVPLIPSILFYLNNKGSFLDKYDGDYSRIINAFLFEKSTLVGLCWSLCCFIIFIMQIVTYIRNILMDPKAESVYLLKKNKYRAVFLTEQGNKVIYEYDKDENIKELEIGHYYNTIKTYDYIYEILEEIQADWIPKEKKGYWKTIYLPLFGEIENIPIKICLYIVLIICLLLLIIVRGKSAEFILALVLFPLFFIGYDLVKRIVLYFKEKKRK